jgi:uncharacterized protein (DUF1697 family)
MPRYVAFLRAINVGGHIVKMDHLRRLVAATGLSNVETFIASGNVIFDAPATTAKTLEKKIETALHEALGYEVVTFVRTKSALAEIAKYAPFSAPDVEAPGHRLYIGLLNASPTEAAQRKVLALQSDVDELHVAGQELYWLCRKNLMESEISGALLEKTLGLPATFRNVNTIRRLTSKYC